MEWQGCRNFCPNLRKAYYYYLYYLFLLYIWYSLYVSETKHVPRGYTVAATLFFIVSTVYGAYLPRSYVGSDGLLLLLFHHHPGIFLLGLGKSKKTLRTAGARAKIWIITSRTRRSLCSVSSSLSYVFDPTLRRIPAVYSCPTVTAELIPCCWVQIITLCALLSFSSSPLLCQFYSPVRDWSVKFHAERKFAKWDLFAANSRTSSRQTVLPKFQEHFALSFLLLQL